MTDFTTKEYRTFSAQKFNSSHKQYKVYLENNVDAEVIRVLETAKNKTSFIRKALRFYVRELRKQKEQAFEASKQIADIVNDPKYKKPTMEARKWDAIKT